MSALPGDSAPTPFVFPPFAPPASRSAPVEPEAVPPAAEAVIEVPLPAHDLGDPDTELPRHGFDGAEAESQSWETPAPPAAEDLPWLEMPAGGPRVHPADLPAAEEPAPQWSPLGSEAPGSRTPADPQPIGEFDYDFVPSAHATPHDDVAPMPWAEALPPATEAAAEPARWDDLAYVPEPAAERTPDVGLASESNATSAEDDPGAELTTPGPDSASSVWEPAGAAPHAGFAEADRRPAPEPVPAPPGFAPSARAEYGEVADRLERIARALRDDPAAFLAGGSGDALGLLVTGFVLGYGHGRQSGS